MGYNFIDCDRDQSSRKIERACQENVAFRVIAKGKVPDHTTISRFRHQSRSFRGCSQRCSSSCEC